MSSHNFHFPDNLADPGDPSNHGTLSQVPPQPQSNFPTHGFSNGIPSIVPPNPGYPSIVPPTSGPPLSSVPIYPALIPPPVPSLCVESLDLADLMKNPHVMRMFTNLQDASQQVIQASRVEQNLREENSRLTARLDRLDSLQAPMSGRRALSSNGRPSATASRSGSVAPSDSVSHAASFMTTSSNSATRPAHYPVEILWNLEDSKTDPDAQPSRTNQSRPSMERCIRHEDGTMITTGEWTSIKVTARGAKTRLLSLPPSRDHRARTLRKTKIYFRSYFPTEWNAVIDEMERQQPLLTLCSAHWKAEHVLSGSLTAAASNGKDTDDDEGDSNSDGKMAGSTHSSRKAASTHSSRKAASTHISSTHASPKATSTKKRRTESSKHKRRSRDNSPSKKRRTDDTDVSEPHRSETSGASRVTSLASQDSSKQLTTQLAASSYLSQATSAASSIVDVNFIQVDPSVDNLHATIARDFPSVPFAADLLRSMKANPGFREGSPTPNVIAFVERIEAADPNSPAVEEDDTDANWGHQQFTAGNMTCSTVLTSWSEIGSVTSACRLIAAALKTCKVARQLCFVRKVTPTSYLSDAYLANLLELLWTQWKAAGGPVDKGKQPNKGKQPDKGPHRRRGSMLPPPPPSSTVASQDLSDTAGERSSLESEDSGVPGPLGPSPGGESTPVGLRERLQTLVREELREWIKTRGLNGAGGVNRMNKDNLISLILSASAVNHPSQGEVDSIIQKRKAKKAPRKPKV